MSKHHPAIYKVGYGRPPEHTRFKPGQSGNPRGRPKGSQRNLDFSELFLRALAEKIALVDGSGRRQSVSKLDGLIKNTINAGLKGDVKAALRVFDLLSRLPIPDLAPEEQQHDYAAEVRTKLEALAGKLREQEPTSNDPKPGEACA